MENSESEKLEKFEKLINQFSSDLPGASIELLLLQFDLENAQLLKRCAIPHSFNLEILQILSKNLQNINFEQSYNVFSELSIFIEGPDELAMHDATRNYLFNQWLKSENYDVFIDINKSLVEYFQNLENNLEDKTISIIHQRKMFHLFAISQEEGFSIFKTLFAQSRFEHRLHVCENLLKLLYEYKPIINPTIDIHLLYYEGKLRADLRQWKEAERIFNHILISNVFEPQLQLKSLNRLGLLYTEQRYWQKAIEYQEKALSLIDEISFLKNNSLKKYHVLHDLGILYRELNALDKAEELFKESIILATKLNDNKSLAAIYNSLGLLYRKHSEPYKALEAYNKSIEYININNEEFRKAQVYNNLGVVYGDIFDWEKSKIYFEKSLKIKIELEDRFGQASTYNNLVRIYQNLNLIKESIIASDQAIAIFKEMRDYYNAGVAARNLARLYKKIKMIDFAKNSLEESIANFSYCNDTINIEETKYELFHLMQKNKIDWIKIAVLSILITFLLSFVFLIIVLIIL